jgi:hypothetical protein
MRACVNMCVDLAHACAHSQTQPTHCRADAIEARFRIFEEGHREDMEINEYGRWQQ